MQCKVCKKEIKEDEQSINEVHQNGACDKYLHEMKERLNESTDDILEQTQLL